MVINVGGIALITPILITVLGVVGASELRNNAINKVNVKYFLAILKFTPLYLNNILILFEQHYDGIYFYLTGVAGFFSRGGGG